MFRPQVPDAQQIADALAKDYKSKLEIPYVSAAIAQLHVLSAASASAAGSTPAQLLEAVTKDPKDHSSRVALAGLLFSSGDREAAIEHLLQSIKIDR
jgi:thioredoxin-like negative regulator of GroEL